MDGVIPTLLLDRCEGVSPVPSGKPPLRPGIPRHTTTARPHVPPEPEENPKHFFTPTQFSLRAPSPALLLLKSLFIIHVVQGERGWGVSV